MRLSDLLNKRARVEVTYAGETFAVDYLPHVITAEVQARLVTMGEDGAAVDTLFEMLPILVAGWEIEGDDGQPLPVTVETLRRFPLQMLAEITTTITQDIQDPNRTTATGAAETPSSSGSSRPALSALPPTGTD